jgi:hypothetical protein
MILKRQINLVKGPKKIKRIKVKIDIKNKNNILIEWWNWKNNNFYKRAKKEIRNLNNEDQIEKYNTFNLDWMMILKNNKTLIKGLRKQNQKNKNKNKIKKYNIW